MEDTHAASALQGKAETESNCRATKAGAVSFKCVREREQEEIRLRRRAFGIENDEGLMGLAISGGGIRSATFSLGVIQRLAEKQTLGVNHHNGDGLLKYFDYLSTVSGGGYIGSWLFSWFQREEAHEVKTAKALGAALRGFRTVETELRSNHTHESEEITFLRQFSNYLTPRVSFFSADTWVVGSIWMRNTLLNVAILVAALAMAVLLVRGGGLLGLKFAAYGWWNREWGWPLGLSAGSLLPMLICMGWNLWLNSKITLLPEAPAERKGEFRNRTVLLFCISPLFSAIFYTIWLGKDHWLFAGGTLWQGVRASFWALLPAYFFIQMCTRLEKCSLDKQKQIREKVRRRDYIGAYVTYLYAPAVSAFVTAALLRAVGLLFAARTGQPDKPWLALIAGPPLVLTAFTLGMIVHIGLMGRDLPEASREWLGRLRGWLTILTLGWLAVTGIAVCGPWALVWVGVKSRVGVAALGSGWIFTTLGGLFAGNSSKTNGATPHEKGAPRGKSTLEIIAEVSPYVFMVGFLTAIACGVHFLLVHDLHVGEGALASSRVEKYDLRVKDDNIQLSHAPARSPTKLDHTLASYWYDMNGTEWNTHNPARWILSGWVPLFAVLMASGLLLALRVDINVFSMFYFYKNRLVRCYLGASREKERKPSPFTGFDDFDDTPLCKLTHSEGYLGPYPIMNAALNVTSGGQLQYQERRAQSFIFTPLHTGFSAETVADKMRLSDSAVRKVRDYEEEDATGQRGSADEEARGYRPTAIAGGGVNVGMAMAISGAAANPNMGYHTSLAVSFFLTVFNVRLGWWFGNALKRTFSRPGPRFGIIYSFRELFGMANADSSYVSLSDGGHFENMGIYELVRRRCQYIICCDGEQDENLTFNGIGNAIRKCRTDLGVEIDLPVTPLYKQSPFSGAHCVMGKIKYPEEITRKPPPTANREGASSKEGYILYLKASLTGDEPTDVLEYHSRQPAFPHQTTGDQWFDESQFESYRKLGYHIADEAIGAAKLDASREAFFKDLAQIWYPRSAAAEKTGQARGSTV